MKREAIFLLFQEHNALFQSRFAWFHSLPRTLRATPIGAKFELISISENDAPPFAICEHVNNLKLFFQKVLKKITF